MKYKSSKLYKKHHTATKPALIFNVRRSQIHHEQQAYNHEASDRPGVYFVPNPKERPEGEGGL